MKKMIRTTLLTALSALMLCAFALAAEGDYGMKVWLEYPAIIAEMTGPEDAEKSYDYRYTFIDSSTGETCGLGGMGLGVQQTFDFKAGCFDRYEVQKGDHENYEVLGAGTLEKPVISRWDAFTIDGITMGVGVRDDEEYVLLKGLDLENYTYTMETEHSGFYIYDALTYAQAEDVEGGAVLYAYRNSEGDGCLVQERSVGYALSMDGVPEENSITIRVTPGMLYGNFTGPEGWNYAPYFYNSANGPEVSVGWSSSFSAGYDVQLLFIDGTADRFRLYDHSDGNYDFLQKEPLYDVALDKPVTGVRDAFPFPVPDVECTVTENPDSRGEWDKYLVTFSGLDLENYTYMLDTQRSGRYMEDNSCTIDAEGLGECTLVAYRASETAEEYLVETSLKHAVTVQFDGSETPDVPDEPAEQEGYGVKLGIWNNLFMVEPVVPAGTDENQLYDIYLYSSETGASFGNTEFMLGGGVIVYEEAGVYDCYRLLKNDTQEVLAEGKLEKNVVTAWDLEVPAGVTVSRTEESDTRDRYTVTGIDLSRYGYELSPDGYGGSNRSEESFVIGKDYFGDLSTLYLCMFSAEEKDDAYYLDRSPYVTVTVNADGGETPEEPADMAVKNLRFIEVQKVPALQWDVPVPKADNVRYHIYLSVDGNQWLSVASTKGDMFPIGDMTPGVYPFIKVITEVDKVVVAETVAKDMSYSYITGEAMGAVEGTLTQLESGKYELCFFGMTPNVAYFMEIIRDHGISTHTSMVDENGVVTYVMDADRVESSLSENGVYQVRELRDCKIGENGKTASITAYLRGEKAPLAGLLGGEIPEEPEIPDVPQVGADITIAVPAGAEVHFGGGVYTTADGKMTILDVTEGTYEAQVKKVGCLTHTIQDIVVGGADIDLGTVELLVGDVDGNDLINARDINGFRREFGKSGEAIGNVAADMNGDGNVNARDINVLRKNFGKSAAKDCTVSYQG